MSDAGCHVLAFLSLSNAERLSNAQSTLRHLGSPHKLSLNQFRFKEFVRHNEAVRIYGYSALIDKAHPERYRIDA
jgi:hypothetical protein